jgi:hypothetical protein
MLAIRNALYRVLCQRLRITRFRSLRRLDDFAFFQTVIKYHYPCLIGQGAWNDRSDVLALLSDIFNLHQIRNKTCHRSAFLLRKGNRRPAAHKMATVCRVRWSALDRAPDQRMAHRIVKVKLIELNYK